MLEKNGTMRISEEDVFLVKSGSLPDKIKHTWDLTLEEIQEVVTNNRYVKVDTIKSNPPKEETK
jgi:hypothetical protein